jgi:Tol biopolymer transport system component
MKKKSNVIILFLMLGFIIAGCGSGSSGGNGNNGNGPTPPIETTETTRVSIDSNGIEGDNSSFASFITSDGKFVVFESDATNLVIGDGNARKDIFVHDRETGATTRVSVSTGGVEGNNNSFAPFISSDGRFVVFESDATNLVLGDGNGRRDIFVHDRQTGATTRVSVSSGGIEGNNRSFDPSISSDGNFVVFESNSTNLVANDENVRGDIFVHNRATGETTRVSVSSGGVEGNNNSFAPFISSDGRFVVFESNATNLVAGDFNGRRDIFVHDGATGETTRVSVSSEDLEGDNNSYAPFISEDGKFVVFESLATNLVTGDGNGRRDIFVHERSIINN